MPAEILDVWHAEKDEREPYYYEHMSIITPKRDIRYYPSFTTRDARIVVPLEFSPVTRVWHRLAYTANRFYDSTDGLDNEEQGDTSLHKLRST